GHVRHNRTEPRNETGYGKRDAAALAAAHRHDAVRIDLRPRAHRLQRAHGIGEDAAGEVGVGVADAARHVARMRRIGPHGVGGYAARPAAAVRARVHDEDGAARRRPEQMLVRKTAAAVVADVAHDAGETTAAPAGFDEPALDWMGA